MLPVDEGRVQEFGRDLLARVRRARPTPLSEAWLQERAMAWTMRDERLKNRLFRFVDALPALRDDAAVVRHLAEYLEPVRDRLPLPARWLLGRQGLAGRVVAGGARLAARRLARAFIAGESVSGASATLERLRRQGLAFTVDVLGETVLSEDEADACQRAYLDLIHGLADAAAHWRDDRLLDHDRTGPIPRVNCSVKLSALAARFEPADPAGTSARVRERLRPILRAARERGAFINIDMEHHAYHGLVLRIVRDAFTEPEFRAWRDVGVAMQAYLTSGSDDLAALAAWARERGTPIWVRLVKGAYWDHETVLAAQNGWEPPVFTDKAATDAAFEACTRFLFANADALRPAIAGHNLRSLAHALACAEAAGMDARDYEFQMLYGMADPLKRAMAGLGRRVRVYAPFGRLLPGMAYLVRRLLENTSNTSFVRPGNIDRAAVDDLLAPPRPARPVPAPSPTGFANAPPVDFSRAPAQAAMRDALARVRATLPRRIGPLIGGQAAMGGATVERCNPSRTGEVVAIVRLAGAADVAPAVAAAQAALSAWAATPVAVRATLLRRVADDLGRRRADLAALITLETGKAWRESDADVAEAVDFCRYYADEAERLFRPRRRDLPGERNEAIVEPRGVCAVIAPWNFPLAILTGMTAAAVVAGNPAIVKPAEQSSAIAAELVAAFVRAGAPAGVVGFLPGIGEEVGPPLVAHPAVATVAFTGSREVGLALGRAAWEQAPAKGEVTRVIAEMGGKNAIIVDDDADLDEAVQSVIASAFGFQGQKCSACSRAIVLDAVHDRFVERLVAAARALRLGEAEDPGADIGPVIDDEARARILARIAEGEGEARLVFAGDDAVWRGRGSYVAPRVFVDVPPSSRLAQEEIFGPVLAVLRARDLDHALAIANGTRYALTGGLCSRSPSTIARVQREFIVGNLYLNRRITGALVDRQPFGGFRLSGVGAKAGGPDYLAQFVRVRVVTENTVRHGMAGEAAERSAGE